MSLLKTIDINSYCVIDFIAYRGELFVPVIKELAIFMPQQNQYYSWVFEGELLEYGLHRKTNAFNEELRSEYGYEIEWGEGDVPYCRMREIVRNATKEYKFVVVTAGTSDEGVGFISEIIGRQACDMGSLLSAVDFDEVLSEDNTSRHCIYHSKENRNICPLRRGLTFSAYFHQALKAEIEINTTIEHIQRSYDEGDLGMQDNLIEFPFLNPMPLSKELKALEETLTILKRRVSGVDIRETYRIAKLEARLV